jgi:hypothetical protein
MFGINWNDPQTMWLNYTNLGLGLVVLAIVGVVSYGFALEAVARWRRRAAASSLDGEVRAMFGSPHTFVSPELGMTMADGGEPEAEKKPDQGKK